MKPDKPHVSFEDIGSDDFDKLLQQLDTVQESPSPASSQDLTVSAVQSETETSEAKASESTPVTGSDSCVASMGAPLDGMTEFVWPAQFSSSQYKTQADSFRQWWQDDRTDAQLLLALLLAFNSAPVYAGSDFICMLLREISRCLVACLENNGSASQTIVKTLEQWALMLGNTNHDIHLRIPAIGGRVESAWMHSASNAATVETVYTWAVYSSGGIVYAAEIS